MIKLAEDEMVVGVIRKHWFLPLIHSINMFLLFMLPVVAFYLIAGIALPESIRGTFSFEISNKAYLTFGISLWGLILWTSFFNFWTDHHLDGWVVTNKRIIDVEQKGFFRREVASFRLERLQDVTTEINGIIATFLKFGDVHVQTAGTEKEFVLNYAPNPKHVKQIILNAHDKTLEKHSGERSKDGIAGPG